MSSSLSGSRGSAGNKIPKGFATGRFQQYGPEQMDVFKNQFGFVQPGSQLYRQAQGDTSALAPQEELAQQQFQSFQGDLASRFSGMGMGARRGSGFQNLATQGAQDFALQLAGQRQQLQRQALNDLMGISDSLLNQRPYEQFMVRKQQRPSRLGQLLGIGLPVAGAVAGGLIPGGGPMGAALGGQLGTMAASGFTGNQGGQGGGMSYSDMLNLPTSWKPIT